MGIVLMQTVSSSESASCNCDAQAGGLTSTSSCFTKGVVNIFERKSVMCVAHMFYVVKVRAPLWIS